MENEWFEKLTEEQKEKLMNCRDDAEMCKVIAESGLELSDDMLDAVCGGLIDLCPSL